MSWERLQKLLDRVESRWALLLLVGSTGAVSARVAIVTGWLNEYGPIAWWGAALLGALVASVIYALVAYGYSRWSRATEINKVIAKAGVNPLADRFERQTILLSDFYNRDYVPHKAKSFKDCYVSGPANVFFNGCTFAENTFRHCQIFLVEPGVKTYGFAAFEACHFAGGVFSNVTFVMTRKMYDAMPDDFGKYVLVINDKSWK